MKFTLVSSPIYYVRGLSKSRIPKYVSEKSLLAICYVIEVVLPSVFIR